VRTEAANEAAATGATIPAPAPGRPAEVPAAPVDVGAGATKGVAALKAELAAAVESGCAALLAMQDAAGWWKGELETNVTMDAEDLLFREFMGIRESVPSERQAAWIRSNQRADGTWATFYGGPPDLSTTVEAYVALRLVGDPPEAEHMARAAGFIREAGGVEKARVFTHIWLALFGLWSWDDVPAVPPELMLLPRWFPFNPYDFGCWARQTIVALAVVASHRPSRPLPFRVDEIMTGRIERPRLDLGSASGYLYLMDAVLRRLEKLPVKPLRRLAKRKAVSWIVERQEADGSWGGIQPPWVYSLLALHLEGYEKDHPVVQAGIAGLEGFMVEKDGFRWLEACQSPVWDTALAVLALRDCGLPATHPSLVKARDWLLDEEITIRGDWAVKRPRLAPGGWAFEFANDNYPDIDDTAIVVMALRGVAEGAEERVDAAVRRGVSWVLGMQSKDGGWGAFDADNTRRLCIDLPFCDFGAVIDPPSADVTAHVLEMLAGEPEGEGRAMASGLRWLLREQERDGSWFGRWGANHVYGVGAAIPALIKSGVAPDDPPVSRCLEWLKARQNADGGWGEDLRSYKDPEWRGRGHSTASQTGWALLALLAAGDRGPETARGLRYLTQAQLSSGSWDEPYFTGTGFPGDFYINYHIYRLVFPLMALGRALEGIR
jgi:squalene-hopene/tetraprenyl-beta-curcumene cyclase